MQDTNTKKLDLCYVADGNKCFSLWLNSASKQVYDQVLEQLKEINKNVVGGGVNNKDHFYFAKTASNISDAIVEEWIESFILDKKNNKNRNNFDPKYDKAIKEALKTASQRKASQQSDPAGRGERKC